MRKRLRFSWGGQCTDPLASVCAVRVVVGKGACSGAGKSDPADVDQLRTRQWRALPQQTAVQRSRVSHVCLRSRVMVFRSTPPRKPCHRNVHCHGGGWAQSADSVQQVVSQVSSVTFGHACNSGCSRVCRRSRFEVRWPRLEFESHSPHSASAPPRSALPAPWS